jgi:phage shock protein PspC (stress-responsive transcriptional regulator)
MKKSKNKVISGVCAGLAESMGIDPLIIRLIFLCAFLFFGTGLGVYLILWLLMPEGNTI